MLSGLAQHILNTLAVEDGSLLASWTMKDTDRKQDGTITFEDFKEMALIYPEIITFTAFHSSCFDDHGGRAPPKRKKATCAIM